MSELDKLKEVVSLQDLASLLRYKANTFSYLIYKLNPDEKYHSFHVPKSNGGTRIINAPIDSLKTLQRRLASLLSSCRTEIEPDKNVLSHGFRKNYSILTNAKCHRNRRYVLNIDLLDFFPSFNFGRVRGFFIKNRSFELNEKIATIIAQIACYRNGLPQGSPCSPIIAELISRILDVRLVRLAKKHKLTYSRYADDITLSTNRKCFPNTVASREDMPGSEWILEQELVKIIEKTGFLINESKTRMQCHTSRQLVTGLIVNKKINIRKEYYRNARAMCHSLFNKGKYFYPNPSSSSSKITPRPKFIESLNKLEGVLSHIHYIKDSVDKITIGEKNKKPNSFQILYRRFLFYKYFIDLRKPIIVCEGKTDSIYLKHAIIALRDFQPVLGNIENGSYKSAVSFLSHQKKTYGILGLASGTGGIKNLLIEYEKYFDVYKHRLLMHPVIVLIDNDDGAKDIFSVLNGKKYFKKNFSVEITHKSIDPFFHIMENLYLVKTQKFHSDGTSCIEDFFDESTLKTKKNDTHGKFNFATKVIIPNKDTIDFSKFTPLLNRIKAVIEHHSDKESP